MTTIHEAYTVLNENGETHWEGQMVRKILEKMNVPNNAQLEACKHICSSNHGTDFVGTVAYLSEQVTKIFPTAHLESKKSYKCRISEIRLNRGRGRGWG